ncbi:MAG: cobalamin biosynthesis protein CobD [Hydrogenophaga sp.]|uniref:adenosylcobinamide-phosphate synthase CbiB n=1 Tax=Hydrogenophaga sp. TaxID=1904254 RepID=UPI001DD70916|nr:adenosylcobinamide-phosphate synthase CbiB [Hydrogenophaga sp.]MBX3609792.1 cobalamin biosynthesis protein CobD [Hydrogenophaga sp.]
MVEGLLSVAVALAIDRCWGEPRAAWHPVVWMGRLLSAMGRRVAPVREQARAVFGLREWLSGVVAWALGATLVVALAWAVQWLVAPLGNWGSALLLGVCLKPLLAWRCLREEVASVEQALAQSLVAGRERLSWLVSRDTAALDAAAVRESAIESLAENLNDSVVAPLLWFAIAGLPGAALYRWANTADAMWGYDGLRRDAQGLARDWTWAGQWAARVDDVLSWVPARITAVLLMLAGGAGRGWGALWREARRTPSPNSGWPMAALALVQGLRLRKPGVYTLHATGRSPTEGDVALAIALGSRALWLGGALWVVAVCSLVAVGAWR